MLANLIRWSAIWAAVTTAQAQVRSTGSLNGEWQISIDEGRTWRATQVPASFEQQIDRNFDGVAWLRRSFRCPEIPAGRRLFLQFDAVATEAEVTVNGRVVGRHLGGWTPFRCDITEAAADPGSPWCDVVVQVDEKVGHNTQGFLPVITPHFGGIWQDVSWLMLAEGAIDDLQALAWGHVDDSALELDVPFAGGKPRDGDQLQVAIRPDDSPHWSAPQIWRLTHTLPTDSDQLAMTDNRVTARIPFARFFHAHQPRPKIWHPGSPHRYQVQLTLLRDGEPYDQWQCWSAFRKVENQGRQLILNGQPCLVRGVLNWGYQQDRTTPTIDPAVMQREITFARERGFNLMKFCLWVPPKAYLDLLDENGMLGWMEYPAWHPQFTPQHLGDLQREYGEFFHYDRPHPSVILRSLTCETGPSADLGVIQSLYDRCHTVVRNAFVEDDSSWIEWNRVHDFYDDHPYGNNHTWVATLDRLNGFIAARQPKPLILGEAIAADTWYEPADDAEHSGTPVSPQLAAAENRRWRDFMQHTMRPGSLDSLARDSRHYAHLMRKFQMETYRREVPAGGYVVSVIRDFPLASMGLIDYFDQPKTTPGDWHWHGDNVLILQTDCDRRSFSVTEGCSGTIQLAVGARPYPGGTLIVRAIGTKGQVQKEESFDVPSLAAGRVHAIASWDWPLPPVAEPVRIQIEATLQSVGRAQDLANRWPIWRVPPVQEPSWSIQVHPSWDLEVANQAAAPATAPATGKARETGRTIWLTRRLDSGLMKEFQRGARVVLLPDGGPGSPPRTAHWFLRGGPVVCQSVVDRGVPRSLLVELQHFDLASDVVADFREFDRFHPLVMLWDNHDIPKVKTHGLAFEAPVGTGWLLVSALRHDGDTNAAGKWLLHQWIARLAAHDPGPQELGQSNWQWLSRQLGRRELSLAQQEWRFRPDEEHQGRDLGWHLPDQDDGQWSTIEIDRAWESQGYADLDGWAWYRTSWTLPADWPRGQCYLSFTGVDDYYRCYVNGKLAGTGGDLEQRRTAFDERKSHDISRHVQPGEVVELAIEVYDWYGAGGVFRPVLVTTAPLNDQTPLFQPAARGALRTSKWWGNPKTFADHFRRHGPGFGATTADDDIQQGSRFFQRSQLENWPTKVDAKGVIRVYNPGTKTFGSFNPDGTIKAFYKPNPALQTYPTTLDCWNAQPGTAPWTP